MGYLAVALVGVMLGLGAARRRVGRHFRRLHLVMGGALFFAAAIHSGVFLAEYGAPPVTWLWFGVAAMALVVATEVHGIARPRLGKRFLPVHVLASVACLVFTVLHWVWFYL